MKVPVLVAALVACAVALDASAQNCTDDPHGYDCPIGPLYTLPGWGNAPWSLPAYYPSIQFGDLDGDGRDEMIGRDPVGVHVWSFNVALGQWQPWVASNGTGELVLPLSDYYSWDLPYYNKLSLIDLAGHAGKILVGRYNYGLVLYKLNRVTGNDVDLPAGTWTQLTSTGPFSDLDCFTNGKCWYDAPYYETLRFGDIDGDPGDEVIGWGGDGIVAFKWNGSEWASISGLPQAGDPAPHGADQYLSIQFADIDGEPGEELLQWEGQEGVSVLKYVPGQGGGSWKPLSVAQALGPLCSEPDGNGDPSCWKTLQTTSFGPGGKVVAARLHGCSANGGGMAGVRYDKNTFRWRTLFSGGPFDDCSGFVKPEYYETIQFAYLSGSPVPELIGRGGGGIIIYQWNGTSWVALSANAPALADSVWALDASYWKTITSANIDGTGRAALLARGQQGMRTWLWQNGKLARPIPYGSFPPFNGAEAVAYNEINRFLALDGTIRDTYIDQGKDNKSSTLRGYVSQIVAAGGGCHDEVSADPPQYQTCTPLAGTSNPAYTTVVNQVIKELWWAASTVDYFSVIQTMQDELFTTENGEAPSIVGSLQLPAAANDTAVASSILGVVASIGKIIGAITGQPEISAAFNAISLLQSTIGFFRNPQGTFLEQTYAQIQGQLASQQEEAKTNNLIQKHTVLSDYGLLSAVGGLTTSQVWTVDETGFLSANRQAFTAWVYQQFLSAFWARMEVTFCGTFQTGIGDTTVCIPPPSNGANIASYQQFNGASPYVNFTGLFPLADPSCTSNTVGRNTTTTCQFPPPSAATLRVITAPVSPECTYDAQAGTVWVYADPNANPPVQGCTLGAAADAFNNVGGWNFTVTPLNMATPGPLIPELVRAKAPNPMTGPPRSLH